MLFDIVDIVSGLTGLSHDQARGALTVLLSFSLAYIFRKCFNTQRVTPNTRHGVSFILGAGLIIFCYGQEATHMFTSSLIVYTIIHNVHESVVQWYVLVASMVYLSLIHINRMFAYNGYVVEISGPLMLLTVKNTYVGFAIYDDYMDQKKNYEKEKGKISKPTLLEYFGYIFNFTSVVCGPPSEFKNYKEFIEETVFTKYKKEKDDPDPSPTIAAFRKLLFGVSMIVCFGVFSSNFAPHLMGDEKLWSGSSFLKVYLFGEVSLLFSKIKYYGAFSAGEASNVMAGLGFEKYDDKGNPLWDKLLSAHPLRLETALNIPQMVVNWNIVSATWLKKCVYNRFKSQPSLLTWFFSALWHGFYPGYYCFFVPMGIGLYVGKRLRRRVRPYFQTNCYLKLFYDVLTWLLSRIILCFYSAAFTMMEIRATMRFWSYTYHIGHILLLGGFLLSLVLPEFPPEPKVNVQQPKTSGVKKSE